jgi:hypothetical protein
MLWRKMYNAALSAARIDSIGRVGAPTQGEIPRVPLKVHWTVGGGLAIVPPAHKSKRRLPCDSGPTIR